MKRALLVDYSFTTRVLVDEDNTDIEVVNELAKPKILAKVENELLENLVGWYDDDEVPYGTLNTDIYYQPDFGDDEELVTPDGVELWSYSVYSDLQKAKEDFPDRKILAYSGSDIENPYFIK